MGRLIDIDKARKEYSNLMDLSMSDTTLLHTLYGVLDNAPTVEAIPKAEYEARLKADMVAMLVAIQLQFASHGCKDMHDCWWLIEEKINALKADRSEEQTGENT